MDNDPANSNKSLHTGTSQFVYKNEINFLNLPDQNFSLMIVLSFSANLSLGVLVKFVIIKKRVVQMSVRMKRNLSGIN